MKGWTDGAGGGNHKATTGPEPSRKKRSIARKKVEENKEKEERMASGLPVRPGSVSVNLT